MWDGLRMHRGYTHLLQDLESEVQVGQHVYCRRFSGFVVILVTLLLLGIGRRNAVNLRGSGPGAKSPRWMESAYLQGLVAHQLPPNWTSRAVESVPIFHHANWTQAEERTWLLNVWCNKDIPLELGAHLKDDAWRVRQLREAAEKLGGKVLFEGHALAMLALRMRTKDLEKLLRRHHELVQFVEEDVVFQLPKLDALERREASYSDHHRRHSSLQVHPPSWGLDRIDQRGPVLGLENASYSYHPKAGESVHVYVLDTGIRTSHKDFGGRAVRELEVNENGLHLCGSEEKDCARDHHGHGTSLAGLLGGRRYGAAKSATIHALKILDDHGRGHSWQLYAALDWLLGNAEEPAIGLLGMSYLGQLSSFQAAASEAQRHSLTLVSAAGDQGQSVHFDACEYTPGFVPSVLTVGATDRRDAKSGFSNGGDCVNVMAPGEGLVSAGCDADDAELRNLSGSGYAAALAAGAAALMLSEKPHLTSNQVISRLLETSTVGRLKKLNGAPDRLINSLGEDVSLPPWAEEGMWSLVDGGKDRECGGLDEPSDYASFKEVSTLELCKEKCENSETTTGCAGISYSHEEEICQIHVELVRSSKQMTGYVCLRHEAPTTTKTTVTTTSLTSSTVSITSLTSTTGSTTSASSVTSTGTTQTSTLPLSRWWKSKGDVNCYAGFGGSAAAGKDFMGMLPLEDCLKACTRVDACEASLYQSFGSLGNCWLRSAVNLPQCIRVPGFSIWFSPDKISRMYK